MSQLIVLRSSESRYKTTLEAIAADIQSQADLMTLLSTIHWRSEDGSVSAKQRKKSWIGLCHEVKSTQETRLLILQ
jgi:hypothetical protein